MFIYETSILCANSLLRIRIWHDEKRSIALLYENGGRQLNSKSKKYALLAMATISLSVLLAMPLSLTPSIADNTRTRSVVETIESASVDVAPTIDGDGSESVWDNATAKTITAGTVSVDIKSVFTSTDVYFKATWSDETTTESDLKKQWSLDAGTDRWGQSTDDEDRLALVWNISTNDFNQDGCSVLCHATMSTNAAGETVDTWHWKAARSNPSGWTDDKFFNETDRQSDAKTSGGYSDNKQNLSFTDDPGNGWDVPKYWEPGATGADANSILQSEIDAGEAKAITEVYTNGTLIDEDGTNVTLANPTATMPGYYSSRPVGSRGDIEAKGVFASGGWTLEWGRALDTGNSDDLQFSDTSGDGEYFFGVAVFDNTGDANHKYSPNDVIKLIFEQPPANQNPGTPDITASATTADVDETLTFDASATDPDGDSLTFSWDFGDGSTGSGASVTHAYTEAGTYTVAVTADDGNGGTSTETQSVTINEAEVTDGDGIDMIWILLIVIIIVVVVIVAVVAMKKRGPPLEEETLEEEPLAEEEL
jgi:hypothetical protein